MNLFKKVMKKILINNHQWNNRKMAFVSILIATSVSFVVIFARILPLTAIPSFKISIGGLPIKITGYIFGPFIGMLTGVISDILSFLMFPTFFHFWYTLAFAFAGLIPGIVGFLMNRRWKNKGIIADEDKFKYNYLNFAITLFTILAAIGVISGFIFTRTDADFSKSIISNRNIFSMVVISGPASMFVATIVARFILKPKTFNMILPIITFSVLLDLINTPLITLGDIKSYNLKGDFLTLLTGHTLMTPIKSWSNLFIIYFAYKTVSPLIYSKTSNGWEDQTTNISLDTESKEMKLMNIKKGQKNGKKSKASKSKK